MSFETDNLLYGRTTPQEQRMIDEGRERRTRRRYVVWGDAEKR